MMNELRRYDIDWLRVIAIGLLIIYHIAIVFQPWAVFIWFPQNEESLVWLWTPMSALNIWRIPFLFFVSGMGVRFAMRNRDWRGLFIDRSIRIMLPFTFGYFTIVPLHIYLFQLFHGQQLTYIFNWGHLWFLGNIYVYVLVLIPLFVFLKNGKNKLVSAINTLFGNFWGLIMIVICIVLEALWLQPGIFEMYAMTWHGFFLGFLAFLFGFLLVNSGDRIWQLLSNYRWWFLSGSVIMYLIRWQVFELKSPLYLMAIESNLWIFAVLGLGYTYLNRTNRYLKYLSEAAYPIYIIHMIFLYGAAVLILPLAWPAIAKLIAITVISVIGCFTCYEFLIKRWTLIRPLFGMKIKPFKLKKLTPDGSELKSTG